MTPLERCQFLAHEPDLVDARRMLLGLVARHPAPEALAYAMFETVCLLLKRAGDPAAARALLQDAADRLDPPSPLREGTTP